MEDNYHVKLGLFIGDSVIQLYKLVTLFTDWEWFSLGVKNFCGKVFHSSSIPISKCCRRASRETTDT